MNDNFNTIHNDDLIEISGKVKMPGVRNLTINQESVDLRKDLEIRANIQRRKDYEERSSRP
jgi:hypothetical protein